MLCPNYETLRIPDNFVELNVKGCVILPWFNFDWPLDPIDRWEPLDWALSIFGA